MMRDLTTKAILFLTCALGACAYDASFSDCSIRCDVGCPDGLACGSEGLCREPGVPATCNSILGDSGVDTPTQFSSCEGLPATCGPAGTDDCCASPNVTGGTFYRSYDVAADAMYPSTSYPATVSSFALDRYEVTVGRFRKFVEAGRGIQAAAPMQGAGAHAKISGSGWDASWNSTLSVDAATLKANVKCDATYQTWTDAPGTNENLPMNCLDWYTAFAFCAWDGGYLPTESEWNFAAAGGSEQRAYPWSSPAGSMTIDCSYANYDVNVPSGTYCVNGMTGGMNRVGSESPRGDGKWGQADLAGNVWEWTLDWDASPYATTTCDDCANLTSATGRNIRGGSILYGAIYQREATRKALPPMGDFADVGVRCARSTL